MAKYLFLSSARGLRVRMQSLKSREFKSKQNPKAPRMPQGKGQVSAKNGSWRDSLTYKLTRSWFISPDGRPYPCLIAARQTTSPPTHTIFAPSRPRGRRMGNSVREITLIFHRVAQARLTRCFPPTFVSGCMSQSLLGNGQT